MNPFKRTAELEVDLRNKSLQEVMNLPEKAQAWRQDFYAAKSRHSNHVEVRVKDLRGFYGGIHNFEYDEAKKKVSISSKYDSGSYFIYSILILPIMMLFFDSKNPNAHKVLWGMTIVFFIYSTLQLCIGIRLESKRIERELVLRINFLNGVMN